MVGLEAMVLGRLGRKPSPHPRACALSCPSSAIYGPGSLGHLTRPFALHPLCVARDRLWCDHDFPGGARTLWKPPSPRARRTGFYQGSELPQGSSMGLRLFAMPRPYAAIIDAPPLGKRGKGLEFRWEAPALSRALPRS